MQVLLSTPVSILLILVGITLIIFTLAERAGRTFRLSGVQQMRIGIFGTLTMFIGIVVLVLPKTSPVSLQKPPTATPNPFITIHSPHGTLPCQPQSGTCTFKISGTAGGIPNFSDYRIYTFVLPVEPRGPGYYLQPKPATNSIEDESWVQYPAFYGHKTLPAKIGNQFRIQAIVVERDATFDGTKLDQLPAGFYLGAIQNIKGIIARSEPVQLTVGK